jgi:hypothetical protein
MESEKILVVRIEKKMQNKINPITEKLPSSSSNDSCMRSWICIYAQFAYLLGSKFWCIFIMQWTLMKTSRIILYSRKDIECTWMITLKTNMLWNKETLAYVFGSTEEHQIDFSRISRVVNRSQLFVARLKNHYSIGNSSLENKSWYP